MECDIFRDDLVEKQTVDVAMHWATVTVISFVNIVNLFFVINFTDFKEYIKKRRLYCIRTNS